MVNKRKIVNKGIAGLGNCLQALGYCCDLASRFDATLCVDWTHNHAWSDPFEDYFYLDCPSEPALLLSEGDFGRVNPAHYTCCIARDPLDSDEWLHGEFLTDSESYQNEPWDTMVVCRYVSRYSNQLFRVLRLSEDIKQLGIDRMKELDLVPEAYDCWHVRHTDKSGGCPLDILSAISEYAGTRKKVVITDSFEVVEMCRSFGIACPSVIPSVEGGSRGGVHYVSGERLGQEGLCKRDVNRSAMTDLLIGGLARHFWGTCQRSTFSDFVYRGRIVSWFRHAVMGQRMNFLSRGNVEVAHSLRRGYVSYKTRMGRFHGWIIS